MSSNQAVPEVQVSRTIVRGGRGFDVVEQVGTSDFRPFWDEFDRGTWEADTMDLLELWLAEGTTFYDIGGWIGPTTLWAAALGARVFTFEPDPVALRALTENLALNSALARNVTVIPAAVGPNDGHIELFSNDLGNSETTLFRSVQRNAIDRPLDQSVTVPMIDIARFIAAQGPQIGCSFIKMDIEGGEFAALPHLFPILSQYDIPIAVTLHPVNISSVNTDTLSLLRLHAVLSALRPYVNHHWYLFSDRSLRSISKAQATAGINRSLDRHFTFVISRKAL